MTRVAGLVLAAVGGYLVVRHREQLRASILELRRQYRAEHDELAGPDELGELAHDAPAEPSPDDAEGIASQAIRRELDDQPYPTSY